MSADPVVPHYHSHFPGEDYLAVALPDYDAVRRAIVRDVVVALILFLVVLPLFLATKKVKVPAKEDGVGAGGSSDDKEAGETVKDAQPLSRRGKKRTNGKASKKPTPTTAPKKKEEEEESPAAEEETAVEFSSAISNILTLLGILAAFAVVFFSDNNLFAARTVIMAPVFTREECARVIDMAHRAAEKNAENAEKEREMLLVEHPDFMDLTVDEKEEEEDGNATTATATAVDPRKTKLTKLDSMLKEPRGWTKDRHHFYPTTDLNLVTDPFGEEDRAWLAEKLNARLAPAAERAFGIFRGAIRANDIFVVRYDATKGQPNLRRHTDSSHLSFNVLLNDAFEGGGTRFHSRTDKSHFDVNPDVGEALISHAEILHEGLATTEGTRYILVGFDAIDERDPFTGEATGLSLFSSWLNFPWMQIRFKEGFQDGRKTRTRVLNSDGDELAGAWKYSRYAVSLYRDLDRTMTMLLDQFAKFRSLELVSPKDFGPYLQAMDKAMERRKRAEAEVGIVAPSRGMGYASWFKGQQIDLDVFGNFKEIWDSRKGKEDKFRGEDL